jgi:hypothetical protein
MARSAAEERGLGRPTPVGVIPLVSTAVAFDLAAGDQDGEGRNRTGDTTIFSRVLYQLSYLAAAVKRSARASLR